MGPDFRWTATCTEYLYPKKIMSNNAFLQPKPHCKSKPSATPLRREILLAWRISLGGGPQVRALGWTASLDLKLREYEPVHATHIPGYVDRAELGRDRDSSTSLPNSTLLDPSSKTSRTPGAALSNDIYMADLKIYHAFEGARRSRRTGHGHRLQHLRALPSRTTRQPVTHSSPLGSKTAKLLIQMA